MNETCFDPDHQTYYEVPFSEFKGQTFKLITALDDEIHFTTSDGWVLTMYHDQSCCESVWVEDITGDLTDLLNTPILLAEEITQDGSGGRYYYAPGDHELTILSEGAPTPEGIEPDDVYRIDSATWTYYKLSTIKGSVTIRWYGQSNGYYSEEVSVKKSKALRGENPN